MPKQSKRKSRDGSLSPIQKRNSIRETPVPDVDDVNYDYVDDNNNNNNTNNNIDNNNNNYNSIINIDESIQQSVSSNGADMLMLTKLKDVAFGSPKEVIERTFTFLSSFSNYAKVSPYGDDLEKRNLRFPREVRDMLHTILMNNAKEAENGQIGYFNEASRFLSTRNWLTWDTDSFLYVMTKLKGEGTAMPWLRENYILSLTALVDTMPPPDFSSHR